MSDPHAAIDQLARNFQQAIDVLEAKYDVVMADLPRVGQVVTFERVHALREQLYVLQDALYAVVLKLNRGQDAWPEFAPDLDRRAESARFVAKVRRAVEVMMEQAAESTKQ